MAEEFIVMTKEHAKRWLSRLQHLKSVLDSRDTILDTTENVWGDLNSFLHDFREAINLSESYPDLTAYIVVHPDGDKFAILAENARVARDLVIEKVRNEYGEIWSTADLRMYYVTREPRLVNNHTWMIKRKDEGKGHEECSNEILSPSGKVYSRK